MRPKRSAYSELNMLIGQFVQVDTPMLTVRSYKLGLFDDPKYQICES